MPQIDNHPPGSFCWAEVATVDVRRTQAFYSELFGWKYDDRPAGAFGTYTMCQLAGQDLAGLYELPPRLLKAGLTPHWMSYLAVSDADAACERIRQRGGAIQQGPYDVMDVGRMAICQDPTGAAFSVWQPRAHKGIGRMGEQGTPCWFELATKDVEKAEAFYTAVFGWSVKAGAAAGLVYREFSAPDMPRPQGGMTVLMPEHGDAPPHWTIYFTVEDCDTDAERARRLGGHVQVPPSDIPGVGRFSVLADPAGACFAIIQLASDPGQKQEPKAPMASRRTGTKKTRKKQA